MTDPALIDSANQMLTVAVSAGLLVFFVLIVAGLIAKFIQEMMGI